MKSSQGIRMKSPAHPGGFVRHEIIEALDLTVTGAAMALGVTRAALSAVLNERARLSPEMALRIEKAFGVSMDTLMRMQNSYDIAKARTRAGEIEVAPFKATATGDEPRTALVAELSGDIPGHRGDRTPTILLSPALDGSSPSAPRRR